MAEATNGDTVRIHYTGYLDNEEQFDSSAGRDPLEFTLGSNQVIPGFEQAVLGMNEGEKKTVTIDPENAYGQYRDELLMEVERSQIPKDVDPEVGMNLQAQHQDGSTVNLKVTQVSDDSVTLDANHPLAGENLTFEIELVEVVS